MLIAIGSDLALVAAPELPPEWSKAPMCVGHGTTRTLCSQNGNLETNKVNFSAIEGVSTV